MPDAETVQSAAAVVKSWIADGTPTAEPVTVETTPAPDPAPAAPTDTPAPAPVAPEPVAVPPVGATPAQIAEFIAGRHGDTEFQVPKGLLLPLKRGSDAQGKPIVEFAPVEELMKGGMRERDYQLKRASEAAQRRDVEAQAARLQARETWLKEQEDQMVAAQKDPQAWEAYQQMQEMYRTNPTFRAKMDDALASRENAAEVQAYRARDEAQVRSDALGMAVSWIQDTAAEFPGVDPERIRTLYADALSTGRATLDPAQVRALYQQEASYIARAMTPLQQQFADLKGQLDALTARQAAETHNATTQHALARDKTPPVSRSGAAPAPVPPGPVPRFGPSQLVDVNRSWAKQR